MLATKTLAPDGRPWKISTLRNAQGITVRFMDWGATWISAQIPLADGTLREALLSCGTPERYLQQSAYMGATVGRYANRIRQAYLMRVSRSVTPNQGSHQLHGGPEGFSHRRWELLNEGSDTLTYQLHSADNDQGFPGNLDLQLTISLNDANRVDFCFTAKSDALTPLSLTNHAYFNLDVDQQDVRQHQLTVYSEAFQPVDPQGLPDGKCLAVAGTSFDFRHPKTLAKDFLSDPFQQAVGGYDHAFIIDKPLTERPIAILLAADGQLQLSLFSREPALQVYSGNYLAGTPSSTGEYRNYQGIALEPGYLPDAVNANPPAGCWLSPDDVRQIKLGYQFTIA
ncbi:galactose-1-epimerase [Rosenbergiella australiborealis]|uniref:galactose-1-epimerase n=1 Tax=Rosenbergiella australiborealis TaxID=1544696 RepID=UPI001F4EF2F2|nr:galactose-1-epimerase [Rosenbergiella australiborealis]